MKNIHNKGASKKAADQQKRKNALKKGKMAEWLACWFLRIKNYEIIRRNLHTPFGEIDILARHGQYIIIVEVKLRNQPLSQDQFILPQQQARLLRSAQWLQGRSIIPQDALLRFDGIFFCKSRLWPVHLQHAWMGE